MKFERCTRGMVLACLTIVLLIHSNFRFRLERGWGDLAFRWPLEFATTLDFLESPCAGELGHGVSHQQKGSPTPVGATYGNQVPILHCPIGYCSLLQSTTVRPQFIYLYIELVLTLYLNILLILPTLEVKFCCQDWRDHPSTEGRLQSSTAKKK